MDSVGASIPATIPEENEAGTAAAASAVLPAPPELPRSAQSRPRSGGGSDRSRSNSNPKSNPGSKPGTPESPVAAAVVVLAGSGCLPAETSLQDSVDADKKPQAAAKGREAEQLQLRDLQQQIEALQQKELEHKAWLKELQAVDPSDTGGMDRDAFKRLAVALQAPVRCEADSVARGLCAAMRMHLDGKMNEFYGSLQAVDRDQTQVRKSLDSLEKALDRRFSELSRRVDEVMPSVKEELKAGLEKAQACAEEVLSHADEDRQEIRKSVGVDLQNMHEKIQGSIRDLHRIVRQQEQYFQEARQDRDTAQERCSDAITELKLLVERERLEQQSELSRLETALGKSCETLNASISKSKAEANAHSDEQHAALQARLDLSNRTEQELQREVKRAVEISTALGQKAASEAREAVQKLNEHFDEMISQGGKALKEQISAAAERAATGGSVAASDLEGGFYGLIARKVLDRELQILLDAALKRLQTVADDVASRINNFCDLANTAERRLRLSAAATA